MNSTSLPVSLFISYNMVLGQAYSYKDGTWLNSVWSIYYQDIIAVGTKFYKNRMRLETALNLLGWSDNELWRVFAVDLAAVERFLFWNRDFYGKY